MTPWTDWPLRDLHLQEAEFPGPADRRGPVRHLVLAVQGALLSLTALTET